MKCRMISAVFLCLLSACSGHENEKGKNTLIIYHEGSAVCRSSLLALTTKLHLDVVYSLKTMNALVVGGISDRHYHQAEQAYKNKKCVYGVNKDEVNIMPE
ncbi:hypothetical protein [Acetobacter thailandicus]|uniref:hypothetical protein n=1 Tax=Acetobacter thailandicus TaxID=1502842 RepID=UPI001BA44971|nr:hypothetical protein [Acetobacter thailandicus]MBS0980506.1 hypothetical protein [Acetobacter thailandicus]